MLQVRTRANQTASLAPTVAESVTREIPIQLVEIPFRAALTRHILELRWPAHIRKIIGFAYQILCCFYHVVGIS
jgi:hypothetical protein